MIVIFEIYMENTNILIKLNELPETLKKEVADFIDFLLLKKEQSGAKRHPKSGCMKGTFTMKKDFDEPLNDFTEYMQ
jgi:hypothetical protein